MELLTCVECLNPGSQNLGLYSTRIKDGDVLPFTKEVGKFLQTIVNFLHDRFCISNLDAWILVFYWIRTPLNSQFHIQIELFCICFLALLQTSHSNRCWRGKGYRHLALFLYSWKLDLKLAECSFVYRCHLLSWESSFLFLTLVFKEFRKSQGAG